MGYKKLWCHTTDPEKRFENCAVKQCVDGEWSAWSNGTACTATCGGGKQTRSRTCTPPKYGGMDCSGDATEEQSCNQSPCPVDGGWSAWGAYTTCTATCGGGMKKKTRSCNNPTPDHGGKLCDGSESETDTCNTEQCPTTLPPTTTTPCPGTRTSEIVAN